MDREYAQMSGGIAYERQGPTTADMPEPPANALDSVSNQLASLEARLMRLASRALDTADRVFGGAVPINAGANGTGNKESVNIPAIMNRIERLHVLAGDLDESINRLSTL